jgi:hypothetical protein
MTREYMWRSRGTGEICGDYQRHEAYSRLCGFFIHIPLDGVLHQLAGAP